MRSFLYILFAGLILTSSAHALECKSTQTKAVELVFDEKPDGTYYHTLPMIPSSERCVAKDGDYLTVYTVIDMPGKYSSEAEAHNVFNMVRDIKSRGITADQVGGIYTFVDRIMNKQPAKK